MSELKKRLSLLKVEKRINQLKGIKDVHFLTDKPKEIDWYCGELNPIDSPLPCLYEVPVDLATKGLSKSIQSLVGNSEFMSGLGGIYTEFTGQRATRQINVLNGHSYASSCLQDYVPEVGFLLYDGRKDELDLSDSIKISQEEFERIWAQAVASGQNDT